MHTATDDHDLILRRQFLPLSRKILCHHRVTLHAERDYVVGRQLCVTTGNASLCGFRQPLHHLPHELLFRCVETNQFPFERRLECAADHREHLLIAAPVLAWFRKEPRHSAGISLGPRGDCRLLIARHLQRNRSISQLGKSGE